MNNNDNKTEQELYLERCRKENFIIKTSRIAVLFLFLVIWELAATFSLIDPFFFSSPLRICLLFIDMCKNFEIFIHTGITLYETILSFFIVNALSILVSVFMLSFERFSKIVEPYLVILNSLPKSALAPLIIVWLGTGSRTIIVAGISVALFGSIINLYTGFMQVDEEQRKLITTLGGSKKDQLTKVILPASIPIILSNMKVNIGLSLVGVIIGEFLAARQGLGYLIIYGSQVFQLDLLIMSIVILCIIAWGLYQSIDWLEKRV